MTRTILRLLIILGAFWTDLACPALAQQSKSPLASLVADKITLNDQSQLVAEGNVYVVYEGRIIRATQIIYDQTTDTLSIEGPIRLEDGDNIIVVASRAELGSDLQNGLLQSARMVLAEQLQLSTLRVQRVSGRYTHMNNTIASSCQICTEDEIPLWQIRARRVIHDTKTKQLHFTGAQFRFGGVPVLYLPRLRMPDPTLKRAAGFLLPRGKSNTLVGYGIKLPYFIPFNDFKDLTLTPYLSSKTKTMEFRYRQMFQNGEIEMTGALTSDSLGNNQARGYLFGDGHFDLKRDYKLSFTLETTLDEAYLSDYTVSTKDRLASTLSLSRTQKHEFFSVEAVNYDSLRLVEDNNSLPRLILDIQKDHRWFPQRIGGETRLSIEGHSHIRASKADITGRDVTRINGDLSWRRKWTLDNGMRTGIIGQIDLDAFSVAQDSEHTHTVTSLVPETAFDLRWPLRNASDTASYDFLEPLLQFGWSAGSSPNIRIDESTLTEFDEGNLLSLSRFTAPDQRERGSRAAIGARWLHAAPSGWKSALIFGQILRSNSDNAKTFSSSSGLNSRISDVFFAGQFKDISSLIVTGRGLLDQTGNVVKAEANATWMRDWGEISANYISLRDDAAENRDNKLSEWSINTGYYVSDHWYSEANIRYDLVADKTATAGLSLTFENECVQTQLSLSRRFASSTNLTPSTDLVVGVDLRGFGFNGSDKRYTRTCRSK